MKQPAASVNIFIAVASLIASILLFMISMPEWMTKHARPFSVPLTCDLNSLPAHFYIVSAPERIQVEATADSTEYQSFHDTAKAVVYLGEAQPGTKAYAVSLEPQAFRNAAVNTNITARITLEETKPKKVPVFVVSSGKLSNPTLVVDKLVSGTTYAIIEGRAKPMSEVDHVRATYRLDTAEGSSGQPEVAYLDPVNAKDEVVPGIVVTPDDVLIKAQLSLAPQSKQAFVDVLFAPGQVASGYAVKNYEANPTSVAVSGTSMSLARIARVATQAINVSGLKQTQTFMVRLKPIEKVKIEPDTVQVTVYVEPINLKGLNSQSHPAGGGATPNSKPLPPGRTR